MVILSRNWVDAILECIRARLGVEQGDFGLKTKAVTIDVSFTSDLYGAGFSDVFSKGLRLLVGISSLASHIMAI